MNIEVVPTALWKIITGISTIEVVPNGTLAQNHNINNNFINRKSLIINILQKLNSEKVPIGTNSIVEKPTRFKTSTAGTDFIFFLKNGLKKFTLVLFRLGKFQFGFLN